MSHTHTHYETLKVARDAPAEVIRSAYRALARKYHPDSNPDLEEAVKAMQELNQAFEVLIDPVQRKAYDEWIDQQNAQTSSATNDKSKKTGQFPHAGRSRANMPRTYKLTPGVVVGIIAVAAALIALVIIALEVQGRSSSKSSSSSVSTFGLAASPTPTPTPAPTPTPTPTPTTTKTPKTTPTPTPTDPLLALIYQIRDDLASPDRTDRAESNKLQGIWIRDSDYTIFQFDEDGHGFWGRRSKFSVTHKPSDGLFILDWGPRSGWTNTLRYGAHRDILEGDTLQGDKYILRRLR